MLNSSAIYDGSTSAYCVCFYGYYSPGNDLTCQPCHYSCEVCSGPNINNCLYCDTIAHRVLTNLSRCVCANTFYNDGINELCQACNSLCYTCFGALATQCYRCVNPNFYMPSQNNCYTTCPDYYFGNITTRLCSICSVHCLHCTDQNTCT